MSIHQSKEETRFTISFHFNIYTVNLRISHQHESPVTFDSSGDAAFKKKKTIVGKYSLSLHLQIQVKTLRKTDINNI